MIPTLRRVVASRTSPSEYVLSGPGEVGPCQLRHLPSPWRKGLKTRTMAAAGEQGPGL